MDWNHRMQNLSISCALVCLIILACSALVGAFGILKHQLSAILITGVMYLLAGVFGLFTLMIIHLKRNDNNGRSSGYDNHHRNYYHTGDISSYDQQLLLVDGVIKITSNAVEYNYTKVWSEFYAARMFTVGWSVHIGWVAVMLSSLTSLLWITVSKVMRRTIVFL